KSFFASGAAVFAGTVSCTVTNTLLFWLPFLSSKMVGFGYTIKLQPSGRFGISILNVTETASLLVNRKSVLSVVAGANCETVTSAVAGSGWASNLKSMLPPCAWGASDEPA